MHPVAYSGANVGSSSSLSPEEIRSHVARVLASPAFRASKRCHRFLAFIVNGVLEGKAATIKERTLATEVFDRSASWDSGGDDTIVRVGAREVRKRLAQYYSSPEGMLEKIRVELPLGSYVPDFVRLEAPASAASAGPITRSGPVAASSSQTHRLWWSLALSGAVIGVALAAYLDLRRADGSDLFWSPYVRSSEPVLVAIAAPLIYQPSSHAYKLDSERFGSSPVPVVRPLKLPPGELNGSDFVPVTNQFVAFGDAVAASNVQLMLAKHNREARVRLATRVEFADFRDSPSIMIGAFTNRWTIELTQHLRYHFGYDVNWVPAILDSFKPGQAWSIPQKQEDGSSPEDYFLICRLPNSPSGNAMLIGAGVAQFGTEAAGRFLTDRTRLDKILKGLKNWQNNNLELVLHAKVIGNSPAAPELVASYVW